jgi:glucose/arabinose dehydrogenase
MAVRHGDPALYVAEQYTGKVVAIVNGHIRSAALLDLHGAVSKGNEQGLLDLAFSPDGTHVYIDYTDPHGDTHVDEYRVGTDGVADPSSRRSVLFERQPFPNHNGGEVLFGPDGELYIGLGDGGSEGDPQHNGQNRDTLLGKILRIDPNPIGSQAYAVPIDNPFVGVANTKPEIWMWGLRNPWRFSFDSATGAMWIGDVGQDKFEEIDVAPKGAKGLNFEWSRREGFAAYNGGTRPPGGVDPVYAISHADGSCAVVGGYVYRGRDIPAMFGKYLFTDDCKGDLLMLTPNGTHPTAAATNPGLHIDQPTSFGEDASGELYMISRSGTLSKIVAGTG